jgi:hypothetical protein
MEQQRAKTWGDIRELVSYGGRRYTIMEIMITAIKEKVRRKELYIIAGIAMAVLMLIASDNSSLSINGKMISEYENVVEVFLTVTHFVCCVLAVVLSVGTIGNEYERKTSHLVWIRGVSQLKYHGQLACANAVISLGAQSVFFLILGGYCIKDGYIDALPHMLPAFFLLGLSTSIISLFTSVLSIKLPAFVTGVLSSVLLIIGVFHSLLNLLAQTNDGIGQKGLRFLLQILPDLNENAQMAVRVIWGKSISFHAICVSVLTIYIMSWEILVFRRKEA